MELKRLILFVLLISSFICSCSDSVVISGITSDFSDKPLDSVTVDIKDKDFKTIYSTISDSNGCYSLKVKKGLYYAMTAVNKTDYSKTKLEFWAWTVPASKDLTINPKIDRLELYGINIFKIQGAYPAYSIYVRPMCLSKFKYLDNNDSIIRLAPKIDNTQIDILLDGKKLKVLSAQTINEFAGDKQIIGFFIQTEYLKASKNYSKFEIIFNDKETGDKGQAICYIKE